MQRTDAPPFGLGERDALLHDVIRNSPIPTFLARTDGDILFANRAFSNLIGREPDACIGLSIVQIIHPDDIGPASEQIESLVQGRVESYQGERRYQRKDGRPLWVLTSVSALPDDPDRSRLIVQAVDIDRQKRTEERLQFANTLLTTAMETSPDGILVVDSEKKIISFNRRFADMFGIPHNMLEAKDDVPVLVAVTSAMKDPEAFVVRVRYLYEHPEETSHDELETKDGRFIDRHTGVLNTAAGEYLGRVWFFRDITERKHAEAQIIRAARCDTLTGLANRAVFMETVEHAIMQAGRAGTRFAVLYLDLDQFKDVNDTLGHPVGDELLKAVAERLRANTRATDIVARFGGDEFAVLVADIQAPDDAATVANKITSAMSDPFLLQDNDIRSAASIGISIFGDDKPDAETMLSRADVALYWAKGEGLGGYRFFTDTMEDEVRTRVTLGGELREAIAGNQLFLVYQPQVELATGLITGIEALVRWHHPVRGVLPPNTFIPVAEKCGLIAALGHWVMRETCRQAKAWLDMGITFEVAAVNLSAVQFKRSFELENDIASILAEVGLAPEILELELTETVLMAASREHNDALKRIRAGGVRLAIDDFGVGYSSLDYLRRFPVDRIKIAQDFVDHIADVAGSAAIVKATIGLARELGINVIAEGIETAEQLELLRSWGCREGQGYLFAKPLAAEDLTPLLRRGRIAHERPIRAKSAA